MASVAAPPVGSRLEWEETSGTERQTGSGQVQRAATEKQAKEKDKLSKKGGLLFKQS